MKHGGYEGTLTEGDILWRLLRSESPWERALERVPVRLVPRRTSNRPVHIDAEIETLLSRAAHQNFVPVLDDREIFIGIVRRQQIIEYCAPRARALSSPPPPKLVTPDPRRTA